MEEKKETRKRKESVGRGWYRKMVKCVGYKKREESSDFGINRGVSAGRKKKEKATMVVIRPLTCTMDM